MWLSFLCLLLVSAYGDSGQPAIDCHNRMHGSCLETDKIVRLKRRNRAFSVRLNHSKSCISSCVSFGLYKYSKTLKVASDDDSYVLS